MKPSGKQPGFKKWLVVALALFVLGLALGFTVPNLFAPLIIQQLEQLGELVQALPPFSFASFLIIFSRNAIAILAAFALSPVLLLAPMLSLLSNGILLSFVGVAVAQQKSVLFLIVGLLPHGVFEIPALIIGEAAALSFGVIAMQAIFSKNKRKQFRPVFKRDLKFLMLGVGLLLPAAAMETYVTPLLLRG